MMQTNFSYLCRTCGETHNGMPALSADAPAYFYTLPEKERAVRAYLNSDVCIVDDQFYFLRSNLLIPVNGLSDQFMWGVWASVSKQSYDEYMEHYENPNRTSLGPYFGWLSSELVIYPDTVNLKTEVQIQKLGIRPRIQLEPTDHPLAIEQREGISQLRLIEIYDHYLHV